MVIRFIWDYFENKRLEILRQNLLEGKHTTGFYDTYVQTANQQGFHERQRTSPTWQELFHFIAHFCLHRRTILDVGCGPYELLAVRNSEDATGIDLSKGALKFLKNSGFRGQVIQADSVHLPFSDNSFDAVYSNQVIEHMLTVDEAKKFVSELERLSGHVMIITPNAAYNRKIRDPTHFYFFTTRSLRSLAPNFRIFATNGTYSETLRYYLMFDTPKFLNVPLLGKVVFKVVDKMDSSRMLNWLNKKLWSGHQLVAIKNLR